MRKLSEIKGEDAFDVLAELLEPVSVIATDKEFVSLVREHDKIGAVKVLLKNHKKEALCIMATLDGEDPKTYAPSIVRLPAMLLDLFNDPELISLFQSQDTVTSSGSVTESTEETDQK